MSLKRTDTRDSSQLQSNTALVNRQATSHGWPMRVKIPDRPSSEEDPAPIRHRVMLAKEKMKSCADQKAYVKPSNLMTGDKVLVRYDPSGINSRTPYHPYVITHHKGTMITAEGGGKNITRNSSFFKKLEPDVQVTVGRPVQDSLTPPALPTEAKESSLSKPAGLSTKTAQGATNNPIAFKPPLVPPARSPSSEDISLQFMQIFLLGERFASYHTPIGGLPCINRQSPYTPALLRAELHKVAVTDAVDVISNEELVQY
ncbi:hypothetical protein AWC38_SpisGene22083 [Stylophora pistillata]|uniref:Uncharacterized protein n=1 Tax=Stylophora pistillata TaxID=50429 RepID=A0A2B4RBY0_STYPI|nr:hypothetical protein AWC38_SpisGene22083 [Stylophora pistillata]